MNIKNNNKNDLERKNNKAIAQLNRLEEKIEKYSDNQDKGNIAALAVKLIDEKIALNKISLHGNNPKHTLDKINDIFEDVEKELDKEVNRKGNIGKDLSKQERELSIQILKEVKNIKRSMENAGKDVSSLSR